MLCMPGNKVNMKLCLHKENKVDNIVTYYRVKWGSLCLRIQGDLGAFGFIAMKTIICSKFDSWSVDSVICTLRSCLNGVEELLDNF